MPSPRPSITPVPTTAGIQLCPSNVTVQVGPRSNPSGGFVNVNEAQSLKNAIECRDVNDPEVHTQATHVWWNPAPLELIFTFDRPYDLQSLNFWNYFGESYDVDEIVMDFYDESDNFVDQVQYFPILGQGPNGNSNPVLAEVFTFSQVIPNVRRVEALISSTNNEIDFQNFVFRTPSFGAPTLPPTMSESPQE